MLSRSRVLAFAGVYGLSGAAFVVGNLLLARVLPSLEYSVFALVVALMNVASRIAPAGADGMVNRRWMDPGPRLLRRVLFTSAVVGTAAVGVAGVVYELDTVALLALLGCILTGGALYTAAAHFQSAQRFPVSLTISQSGNLVLVAAAIATMVLGVPHVWLPLTILVAGRGMAATSGWIKLLSERPANPPRGGRFLWGEAL